MDGISAEPGTGTISARCALNGEVLTSIPVLSTTAVGQLYRAIAEQLGSSAGGFQLLVGMRPLQESAALLADSDLFPGSSVTVVRVPLRRCIAQTSGEEPCEPSDACGRCRLCRACRRCGSCKPCRYEDLHRCLDVAKPMTTDPLRFCAAFMPAGGMPPNVMLGALACNLLLRLEKSAGTFSAQVSNERVRLQGLLNEPFGNISLDTTAELVRTIAASVEGLPSGTLQAKADFISAHILGNHVAAPEWPPDNDDDLDFPSSEEDGEEDDDDSDDSEDIQLLHRQHAHAKAQVLER